MYNIVLIISIIIVYFINFLILKRNAKPINYVEYDLNKLSQLLLELSFSFNNQILEIKKNQKDLKLYLKKYQEDRFWKIKIIIEDIDEELLSRLKKVLADNVYDLNIKSSKLGFKNIEIFCENNLGQIEEIINRLSDLIYINDEKPFYFIFTKKSVIV